jgi:hypothetical protein
VGSPKGDVEGVVVETNGGATTSFGYDIYVVASGKAPEASRLVATLYGALRNEHSSGVNLTWSSSDVLLVEFMEAKIAKVVMPVIRIGPHQVWVALSDGNVDPRAPAGGMLMNVSRER